jgi:chromosomal replication initiation ATPase DnaA
LKSTEDGHALLRGIDLDDILAAVARDCGASLAELTGPRPGGDLAAARCRVAYVANRYARIPIRRVARRFGRDDSSFSRPLDRLQRRLDADPDLRTRIDRLVDALRSPPLTRESTNQD